MVDYDKVLFKILTLLGILQPGAISRMGQAKTLVRVDEKNTACNQGMNNKGFQNLEQLDNINIIS